MEAAVVQRLALALGTHAGLSWLAWRLGTVSRGAAVLGGAFGTLFVLSAGWAGWLMLAALVGLGFAATAAGWDRKRSRGLPTQRRHAGQVLAKGGVATACALLAGAGATPHLWLTAAAGALAAALADTLGTELGVLGRGRPRLLPRLQSVPVGTPGAVSLPGTAAAALAAWVPGLLGLLTGLLTLPLAAATAGAGFVATLVESLLAARPEGRARPDAVAMNLLTTLLGALLAGGAATVLGRSLQ